MTHLNETGKQVGYDFSKVSEETGDEADNHLRKEYHWMRSLVNNTSPPHCHCIFHLDTVLNNSGQWRDLVLRYGHKSVEISSVSAIQT